MWSRAQLKTKAKYALKQNYWKIILVTLLVYLVGGATSTNFQTGFQNGFEEGFESGAAEEPTIDEYDYDYSDQYFDMDNSDAYYEGYWDGLNGEEYENELKEFTEEIGAVGIASVAIIILVVVLVIFAIAIVIALVLSAFLLNPIEVGIKRFFYKTLNENAQVKEVAFAFDNSYKNVVKILFFRDLYTILWTMLFIIPGIVKSYEYKMIPYLLAENPNLTKEQAFALSKQMMEGQKWKAFVLHLSFFGWDLLSVFTFGILSIFYVEPYRNLAFAALYEELSLINGRPAFSQNTSRMVNPYQQVNSYAQPVDVVEPSSEINNTEEY